MKKIAAVMIMLVLCFAAAGCSSESSAQSADIKNVINGSKVYYELVNGNWSYRGFQYQYRLEIPCESEESGKPITYVYLSTMDEETFLSRWDRQEVGNREESQFKVQEAVLVDVLPQ